MKNISYFLNHNTLIRTLVKEKRLTIPFDAFILSFHCLHSSVPGNKYHKQKQHMSFFIHIKLVVHVLVCAYAIRHIKWRRLNFLTLYNMLYHVHGSCSCCDKFGVLNSKNIHLIYIKVIFGKKFATFLLPGSMYVINLLSCKPLLWK